MPYVGMHSFQEQDATNFGPGLRFGSFVGGRVNDICSLNAQLSVDIVNANNVAAGTDFSEYFVDFAFSPLFQIPAGSVEFVIGPKAGLFVGRGEQRDATSDVSLSMTGLLFGVNAGLFFPVSETTSLGVLASWELKEIENACARSSGQFETCSSVSSPTMQVVGLTAGALF
jgi:hypothetical protein